MKPNSKDRLKVFLIFAVFLLVVSIIGYGILGRGKVSGMTTPANIIKAEDVQQIEQYKKYLNPYAVKVQEDSKYYLKFYGFDDGALYETKVQLKTDQYNSLVEGKSYWLDIKFSKTDDVKNGTLKKIYTDDPHRD